MKINVPSVPEHKKVPKLKTPWLVAIVTLLVLGGIALYYFNQYQQTKNLLQNPGASADAQAKQLIDQVGKLMLLPTEKPSVATVSDVTKLQDQPFFTHAQNGDKLLLFSNANIIILFRPSINKIIQVGSLSNVSNNVTPAPPAATATPATTGQTVPILNLTPTATPAQ